MRFPVLPAGSVPVARRSVLTGLLALGTVSALGLGPAWAANAPAPTVAVSMAAHRANYNLTLITGRGGDVIAASGKMTYEVVDACDGWAVRQRLAMTLTNTDGQNIRMVSDYATWESKDGLLFRFHMRQTTDDAVTSQTDGEARLTRAGGPGTAHYTGPSEDTKDLPAGTLFPMAHTEMILTAAREGKKYVTAPLFDGTSDDGAQNSGIAITDVKPPQPNRYPALAALPSTRVRLAFFDRDPATMLPDYEVGMRYWENGVADDMTMDFEDFVMHASMVDFTPLSRHC